MNERDMTFRKNVVIYRYMCLFDVYIEPDKPVRAYKWVDAESDDVARIMALDVSDGLAEQYGIPRDRVQIDSIFRTEKKED